MMKKDTIIYAIKKMPDSVEVWMHPKHIQEDFTGVGVDVKFSLLIPEDTFVLFKERMQDHFIKELERKWTLEI